MNPDLQRLVTAAKLSNEDAAKLDKLPVGTACQHKGWGLGRIAEWDLLGDRIIIDFETKTGQAMKLSFVASSVQPLDPEHLLARRVNDLAAMQALAKQKPIELVELALKSSGGKMSLDDLERLIQPKVVETAVYKKWWDNAKKELKAARHIVVPTKRTDPLILRAQDEKAGAVMLKDYAMARDLRQRINAIIAVQKDLDLFENATTELKPIFDDVRKTVLKSYKINLKDCVQLALTADELRESVKAEVPEGLGIVEIFRDARNQLPETASALPNGLLRRFYAAFPAAFPEGEWIKDSFTHLTRVGGKAVEAIADVMDANDQIEVLTDFLKKAVRNRSLSTDLLIWMCNERKGAAALVFDIDLGNAILDALHQDAQSGGPKRSGRLQTLFADDRALLGELVADADEQDLRLFAKRVLNNSIFDELTKRSLMGKIIKSRPEMEKLMEENVDPDREASLIVSWESLERKKAELHDITTVQIPQNKKDIQIARDYGDLRENFEYKSARQQQAVLERLKSKYERELGHCQGTDFSNVDASKVEVGTIVEIRDSGSGQCTIYTILGAWDGNAEQNIISYLSATAKALIGKVIGNEVEVPSDESGTKVVKILSIEAYKKA